MNTDKFVNTDKVLKPTCDRKTRAHKNQQNTFGLLPGPEGSCPDCTMGPGGCWHVPKGRKLPTCYVAKLQSAYKGINAVLQHNTELLKRANYDEKFRILTDEFKRFETAERKRDNPSLCYRLHWAGDIFSAEYADALSAAMLYFPSIKFWIYTRSFNTIPYLLNLPNLNLILSLDPCNVQTGLLYYHEFQNTPHKTTLQLSYMAQQNDFADQLKIFRYKLVALDALYRIFGIHKDFSWLDHLDMFNCPVDTGAIKLEQGCYDCKHCSGRLTNPIWFAT